MENNIISNVTYAPETVKWPQRLLRRMFSRKQHFPIRDNNDLAGFALGYLETNVVCCLGWQDRLRILLSGKLEVLIRTKTDVLVNRAESESIMNVLSPNYKVG